AKRFGLLNHLLPAAGLVLLCLGAYWPLFHAGYIWDDDVWLTQNGAVQSWNGLWYIWFAPQTSTQYYPLVYTAFLLQFKLWGLNPLGYHLVNIGLQAINSILLWRILRLLGLKSAWVAAAVWAIHPVQVETVGWITEQKNLLSAALGFSAALLWIKWAGLDVTGKMPVSEKTASGASEQRPPVSTGGCMSRVGDWKLLLPATILFVLALLAKTDICTLPAALLLVAWWKQGRITRAEILSVIPWLLVGALLACMTIYIEHGTAGALGPAFGFSLEQRLIIAGKDFWFYPLKLFWPHPLLAVYPRWDVDHFTPADWVFPAAALAAPVVLWLLRKKIGCGPFTAVAYYAITISPVLGFTSFYTMIYTFVADHYQYLASIGIIVLVVESAAAGWERLRGYLKKIEAEKNTTGLILWGNRPGPMIAASALLLELGVLTWGQSQLYRKPTDIWNYVLSYHPNSWLALEQVGLYNLQAGDIKDAEEYEEQAMAVTGGENFFVDANLAYLYVRAYNDISDAIPFLEQSVRLNPYQAYNIYSLATFYEQLGQMNKASALLNYGLKLMPRDSQLHRAMGEYYARIGQPDAAITEFRAALDYTPDDVPVMYDLAIILANTGRQNEAFNECQRILTFDPGFPDALLLCGKLLLLQGQPSDAIDYLRQAVDALPDNIDTHLTLALALEKTGDPEEAAVQRAIAVELEKQISSSKPAAARVQAVH
ncbi:MAG TPA: tetratricopeptide repeat protein, partial [Phycisphaerae bacterium]|nr:tetratricopeptide repeat protein [Phycisphaerae bacterium]